MSVVVATYGRAGRLRMLLDGLAAQTLATGEFEVVVVDDASEDETPAVLAAAQAGDELTLRTIAHDANLGRAQARQSGWQAAAADVIAFIDDDCVPDPAWLERGLAACAESPGAIVQGRTAPNPSEREHEGPFSRTVDVPSFDAAFRPATSSIRARRSSASGASTPIASVASTGARTPTSAGAP